MDERLTAQILEDEPPNELDKMVEEEYHKELATTDTPPTRKSLRKLPVQRNGGNK